MTSSRDSHTSQSREVPAAITEAIGLLEIHGYDSAAENLRDWSNGHFRPVQSQGEVITPEAGQAYVDAQGKAAYRRRHNDLGYAWRECETGNLVADWDFTPISKLVPESQPRGSVVTEADIASSVQDITEWQRKHFLNKSIPVAAGTVKGKEGGPLHHKDQIASAGESPVLSAPSPSTDDFDIRVGGGVRHCSPVAIQVPDQNLARTRMVEVPLQIYFDIQEVRDELCGAASQPEGDVGPESVGTCSANGTPAVSSESFRDGRARAVTAESSETVRGPEVQRGHAVGSEDVGQAEAEGIARERFTVIESTHDSDPTLVIWRVCDDGKPVLGLAGKELADKVCALLNGVQQLANDVVGDANMLYHSADLAEPGETSGGAALRMLRRDNDRLRELTSAKDQEIERLREQLAIASGEGCFVGNLKICYSRPLGWYIWNDGKYLAADGTWHRECTRCWHKTLENAKAAAAESLKETPHAKT